MSNNVYEIDAPPVRAIFFIDYWNYELTMKQLEPGFWTDWFQLPHVIAEETAQLIGLPVQYEGCFVFGSYDPDSEGDIKLRSWADKVLSRIPGVMTRFSSRQRRSRGPQCTGPDHHEIAACPVCGSAMLGMQEKGVDIQIATEMMDLAFSGRCEVIVLVSSDKDFVPAVEKLWKRGIKVVHAFFPNQGHDLANKSWASFDLFRARDKFRRAKSPYYTNSYTPAEQP